ncbi:MAG: T9SS type A sorting domain-containing protein, partial [Candidatus Electryonea clarkiae]|nr:T9SS type A sorting domain-containing protein [Candidatus Electryonea clarkiae]
TKIYNNIFINNSRSIWMDDFSNIDSLPKISNNIFLDCDTTIWSYREWDELRNINYNCFYNNNVNNFNFLLDTTNLFAFPVFADSVDYYLFSSSPLINAGNPDSIFNDLDGTRNDIGLWGGPFGMEYDYPTEVIEASTELPLEFSLGQPYPNPFNSMQIIPFALPKTSDVSIKVFNILGREVHKSIYPSLNPGRYLKHWDASNQSSGIYFVQFEAGEVKIHKKVLLIK